MVFGHKLWHYLFIMRIREMGGLAASKRIDYIFIMLLHCWLLSLSLLLKENCVADALRTENGVDPFVVDYSEYYYRDLRSKLTESMSVNNCSIHGHGISITRPEDAEEQVRDFDFSVELVHPTDTVKKSRGALGKEKGLDETKLFLQVSLSLCKSKLWSKFKKGELFKGSRGCADRYSIVDGKKVKVINKRGMLYQFSAIQRF
jgi:hypothetical protein